MKINTPKEIVQAWDNYDIVNTIEMGGMGPGYEQAIQIAMIECLRFLTKNDPPKDGDSVLNYFSEALTACDELGLSGAQASAAGHLAYQIYSKGGVKNARDDYPESRHIMVSRDFPFLKDPRTEIDKEWAQLCRDRAQLKKAQAELLELYERAGKFCAEYGVGELGRSMMDTVFELAETQAKSQI